MPIYLQNYDMEGESNLNIKITGEDTKEISLDFFWFSEKMISAENGEKVFI